MREEKECPRAPEVLSLELSLLIATSYGRERMMQRLAKEHLCLPRRRERLPRRNITTGSFK